MARRRIGALALIGATCVGGAFKYGQHVEQERSTELQDGVDAELKEELKDITFYLEYKFSVSKDRNVSIFHHITDEMLQHISFRYNISDGVLKVIKPSLESYLLRHKHSLNSYSSDRAWCVDAVDRFVAEHAIVFRNNGVVITKPYAHLDEYQGVILKSIEKEEDKNKKGEEVAKRCGQDPTSSGLRVATYKHIGEYQSEDYGRGYELCIKTTHAGRSPTLLARHPIVSRWQEKEPFTESSGRAFAQKYQKTVERYDSLALAKFSTLIQSTVRKNEDEQCVKSDEYKTNNAAGYRDSWYSSLGYESAGNNKGKECVGVDEYSVSDVTEYKDSFGRFHYKVGKINFYKKDERWPFKTVFVAKAPEDKQFSAWRGKEAAERVDAARGY